jgi:phage terminase large subunit
VERQGRRHLRVDRAFDVCDERGVWEFRYDADGLGADVRGDARFINERRAANHARQIKAIGYRGSEAVFEPEGIVEGTIGSEGDKGRTNKDYFGNRKAQGWWALRRRFQRTYRWVQYVKTGGKEGAPCARTTSSRSARRTRTA